MIKRLILIGLSLTSLACAEMFFSPDAIQTHLKGYTEEEKLAIEKDLDVVRSICLPQVEPITHRKPLYIATAGAPGSRKTTILERLLTQNPSAIAYVDPDARALKFMVHTYYSQSLSPLAISEYEDYSLATKAAYEKWRGGSNYIALTLLEEAFAERRDIAHGTTATGEHIPSFLARVKDSGYEITLLLCSCEDSFRYDAIQYRNQQQKFYQSTPEDAVTKGKFFPQRMSAYFTYADTLYLFWSDDLSSQERIAAILTKGTLEIKDQEAFDRFVAKFESDRTALQAEGKNIPSWSELLAIRFH